MASPGTSAVTGITSGMSVRNGSGERQPLADVSSASNSVGTAKQWLGDTVPRVFQWLSDNPAPAAGAMVGICGAAALMAAYFSKTKTSEGQQRATASPMRQSSAGRSGRLALLQLDEYERAIRKDIVLPHQIEEGFDDIGGLEEVVSDSLPKSALAFRERPRAADRTG
jgi:hypothetical protein